MATLALSMALTAACRAQSALEEAFLSPPDDARPVVWWRWRGSQIAREGITADLEALQEAGL